MNNNRIRQFITEHGYKFIALVVAFSLLISISGIGTAIVLVRKANQAGNSTKPTNSTTETKPTATAPQTKLELEKAAEQLTAQIKKNPNDPSLYTQRAAVYYNLGRTGDAIADYTSALALKEDPQTRYLRAVVYAASGNNQSAYEDLAVALEAKPENKEYLSLMADTCNALKKYDQALIHLNTLLVADPDNCVLRTLAGDACIYLEKYEESLPHYEKAISCYNDAAKKSGISKASLYNAYGNALKTLERYAQAAEAYDQSLQLEETKELYFQRGFCMLQTEKYAEANADFTKCIELGYETASASFQRGLCYYATAEYTKAIADFKVYEEAFPDKTDSLLYMGLCYQNEKDYTTAISYYKKCIDADISVGNCYFNLGNCYYNQEDFATAVDYYTKAIEKDSYLYESLLNRGVSYVKLNKYNEAKADLKKVIDECKDTDLVENATKSYDPIKNITIITKK